MSVPLRGDPAAVSDADGGEATASAHAPSASSSEENGRTRVSGEQSKWERKEEEEEEEEDQDQKSSSCAGSSCGCPDYAGEAQSESGESGASAAPATSASTNSGVSLVVERKRENTHSASCRWTLTNFSRLKQRAIWSRYFDVGGYDCRLLVYPKGDSQALPGYMSIYLQVTDPSTTTSKSSKWDCFVSYRLAVVNQRDSNKVISRDSWHRFSAKKKSHGWCDFTPTMTIGDQKAGYLVDDSLIVSAEILVLHETIQYCREPEGASDTDTQNGKFTWKVHNFSLFREMIKTQKIMSPQFPAGECNLRLSVYQSVVNGVDYLSMCLESKDTERSNNGAERSCWCLFRMSGLNQVQGKSHVHRDSYGRFAADSKSGDNTSLGWNDYMKMDDFVGEDQGFVVGDTAVFSASFYVIRESASFSKSTSLSTSVKQPHHHRSSKLSGDTFQGKFVWKIENFTKLKDLLKKRKITGLCIKSRRFQVGGRDCRLIVYPRGQAQPPCNLSMFLEVTDPKQNNQDWSCFVSHRLSVVNQKSEADKSVTKESQNRYSRTAKDWGWREFVSLTSLFDQDAGFLMNDAVVFSAEVLVLKESSSPTILYPLPVAPSLGGTRMNGHTSIQVADPQRRNQLKSGKGSLVDNQGRPIPQLHVPHSANGKDAMKRTAVESALEKSATTPTAYLTWKVENFPSFKEIMETRKIFSRYFNAGKCELRLGVYESYDILCIYLESDNHNAGSNIANNQNQQSSSSAVTPTDVERNFWVRYRISVVNQKKISESVWKESTIYTRTWNNSVLQFMKVSELLDVERGFLVKDTVIFSCEVLECCPWPELNDIDVLASDEDHETLSTDGEDILESDENTDSMANSSISENERIMNVQNVEGFQPKLEEVDSTSHQTNGVCGVDERASESECNSVADCPGEDHSDFERDDEDVFCSFLNGAGFYPSIGDSVPPVLTDPSQLQLSLREKLVVDTDAAMAFLTGLGWYLRNEDPTKAKSLLLPTTSIAQSSNPSKSLKSGHKEQASNKGKDGESRWPTPRSINGIDSPSLISVLMGVKVLQEAIVELLLEIMVEYCVRYQSDECTSSSEKNKAQEVDKDRPQQPCGEAVHSSGLEAIKDSHDDNNNVSEERRNQTAELLKLVVESLREFDVHNTEDSKVKSANQQAHVNFSENSRLGNGDVASSDEQPKSRSISRRVLHLVESVPSFLQKDVVELIPRVVSKDEYSFMALSIIKRLEAACEAIDLERERDMDFDISTAVQGGVHNSERDEESKDSISTKITSDKIETMISCLETLHLGDEKLLRGNQDAQGGEGEGSEDNHNLGYRSCKVAIMLMPVLQESSMVTVFRFIDRHVNNLGLDQICEWIRRCCYKCGGRPGITFIRMLMGLIRSNEEVGELFLRLIENDSEKTEQSQAFKNATAGLWKGKSLIGRRAVDVHIIIEVAKHSNLTSAAEKAFVKCVSKGSFGKPSLEEALSCRSVTDGGVLGGSGITLKNLHTSSNSNSGGKTSSKKEREKEKEKARERESQLERLEFDSQLHIAESLAIARDSRARELASSLYKSLLESFSDQAWREESLRGLAEKALQKERENSLEILAEIVSREGQEFASIALRTLRDSYLRTARERDGLRKTLKVSELELDRSRSQAESEVKLYKNESRQLAEQLASVEAELCRVKSEIGSQRAHWQEQEEKAKEIKEATKEAGASSAENVLDANDERSQAGGGDSEGRREAVKPVGKAASREDPSDTDYGAEQEDASVDEDDESSSAGGLALESRSRRGRKKNKPKKQSDAIVVDSVQSVDDKDEALRRCQAYIDALENRVEQQQGMISSLESKLAEESRWLRLLSGTHIEQLDARELEILANFHRESLGKIHSLHRLGANSSASGIGSIPPALEHINSSMRIEGSRAAALLESSIMVEDIPSSTAMQLERSESTPHSLMPVSTSEHPSSTIQASAPLLSNSLAGSAALFESHANGGQQPAAVPAMNMRPSALPAGLQALNTMSSTSGLRVSQASSPIASMGQQQQQNRQMPGNNEPVGMRFDMGVGLGCDNLPTPSSASDLLHTHGPNVWYHNRGD